MSSHLTCHHCGSSEFETDQARGDTVCMKCGIVIEDNVIVNEIQFEEGNFGGTHVVGQRVTEEYGSHSLAVSGLMGSGKQSRQLTLENAKKKIKNVGSQLNLNSVCIDQAFGFYKMALNRRLTHGRKNTHVIAACVYMVCRLELTPHILLDLSDVMQVNVYELGKTYLKLSSSLCLNIPPIDPCIYIMRYAHRLGIKGKANEVQLTALRLVSRMKRDWMHTGRRPSGLCGAALLVSARLHGMHCSIKDVIQVVKVCETTIRKRLNEFGDTPSSKLTVDEFLSVDLEGEEDPPCYKTARKKNKTDNTNQNSDDKHQEKNELELKEEYNLEIEELQKKIDEAVEKSRKKLKGPFAKYAKLGDLQKNKDDNEITNGLENVIDENVLTRKLIEETTVETIRNVLNDNEQPNLKEDSILDELNEIDDLRPTVQSLGLNTNNNNNLSINQSIIEDNSKNNQINTELTTNNKDGELYFEDLDDSELESYLLNKKEIETKTNYWLKYHADYLKEVEEKERKKQVEEELRKEREAKGEISPKKKRKSRKRTQIEANSAGEAIEKMLIEKKISNKINYDVLKKLTNEQPKEEKIKEDYEDGFLAPKMESSFERGIVNFSRISSNTSSNALKRLPSIRSQMNLNKSSNSIINENHVTKFKANSLKSKLLSSSKLRNQKLSTNANQSDDLLSPPKEKISRTDEEVLITTKKQNIEVEEELEDEESEDDNDYCVEKEREELSLANFMSDNFVNNEYNEYEEGDEYDEFDDYS